MPEIDSSQHPLIYRAASKRRWLSQASAAFFRKSDEVSLSVILSAECTAIFCAATLNTCFGELILETHQVMQL